MKPLFRKLRYHQGIARQGSFFRDPLLTIRVPDNRGPDMPACPRRIAVGPLPARHLVQRAVPVLRYLERPIHPRGPTPLDATKRLVGAALASALISLADLQEDGSYSRIALRASVIVLAVELAAV